MISFLKGILLDKSPNEVTIDVGGVGYQVFIPLSTYSKIGNFKEPVELFIYTHLRDDCISLFGFFTKEEKEIFTKLISISGIGPKLALNILSGLGPEELEEAIRKNDFTRLTAIPGIGRKTALRIALELQEKFEEKKRVLTSPESKEKEEIISALINLGFKRKEVEKIVDDTINSFPKGTEFEKLFQESLKKLSKL
ncbi:Holliday junction branch migration protein RuvA [SCandidatus Aminicenantes bacterium Aminicenantia_JdfR_composite]|jgi:Holliday junction DNA helicase RuvA|nr:Holliday junction branch migration protein RuvA [SCandidatus Aminicenantes bacterium Aminicenantia_JdfR_composite]